MEKREGIYRPHRGPTCILGGLCEGSEARTTFFLRRETRPENGPTCLPHYQGGNSKQPPHTMALIIIINCSISEPKAQRWLGHINKSLN